MLYSHRVKQILRSVGLVLFSYLIPGKVEAEALKRGNGLGSHPAAVSLTTSVRQAMSHTNILHNSVLSVNTPAITGKRQLISL